MASKVYTSGYTAGVLFASSGNVQAEIAECEARKGLLVGWDRAWLDGYIQGLRDCA